MRVAYLNFLFSLLRDFVSNALIVMLIVLKLTFDCNPEIMYDMRFVGGFTPLRDVNAAKAQEQLKQAPA